MEYLDVTLRTARENIACDEALLVRCRGPEGRETLRVWEAREPFVVVGYSNRNSEGVRLERCRGLGIPVFRRHSGGGTVIQGPGILSYAVVLPNHESRSSIRRTNRWIMARQRRALARLLDGTVAVNGFTDLTLDGRKFSGNAQYRNRDGILFHGTFLLGADLGLIEELLEIPSSQPDYRRGRSHADFLVNLGVEAESVRKALREEWGASETADAPELRKSIERVLDRNRSQPVGFRSLDCYRQ